MKKLLTICLLLTASFTAKAQDMSFEETVKYINDKLECCSDSKASITAKKDGTITIGRTSFNFFDLQKTTRKEGPDPDLNGISIFYNEPGAFYGISFHANSKRSVAILETFTNIKEAERTYNAFQHLRSLCKKEKDPFDN